VALNQQYGTKAEGSKKSTWLADKVLNIIKNLHTDLAVFDCCGVMRLFKVVLIW